MTPPTPPGLYRHPTRSEIIDLAAAEGHDADIPTNMGSIHQVPSHTSASPRNVQKDTPTAIEKDIEKTAGSGTGSISTTSTAAIADEEDAEPEPDPDPNIIDFDGPDDPENPLNWPATKKWGMVSLISAITFLTPLASSQFAPGVPQVMRDFDSTSDLLEGFMVSVYVLGFAFGPLIIAPLSEMYGRLPLYHSCNFLFIVFTVAAAVASSMGQFVVFRFLMGCFGGAPMVLGGGTIADLIPREQRGTAMAVWMMGPTVGPCVGPIIGGFLTVAKGWRWNFWFVAIVAGAFFLASLVLMSETSAIIILQRKVNRLRTSTGNKNLVSKLDTGLTPSQLFTYSIVRPAKMLFQSTICFAISLYIAVTYSYLYILFTTFTAVFTSQYHWHGGITGLSFLGLGIGSLIGQFTYIRYGNQVVHRHIRAGDFRPEHRLYMMCIGGFFIPMGLFVYGWSVHFQTHFMVPMVATGVIGFGLLMTFMPATTYLVDVFTVHAASAMAASTVLRSLAAAFIPLSSQTMYARLGYGWGNSMLGFIATLLVPIPFLFIRYGQGIRARSRVKL
ncbi:MFS general substrate transporter [Decorospora gaudefroyi]|uniref:MFS general substrate transporter n=1 Tax=Decorospora gaudefroyi TaxID=184978 RepID=A0A6A5KBR2_9PLEO|nr:MFS general substrate transporter [Decorospora gaudefroyi]